LVGQSDRAVRAWRAGSRNRAAAAYCAEEQRRSPPSTGKQPVFVHGSPLVSPKSLTGGGARGAAASGSQRADCAGRASEAHPARRRIVQGGIGMAKKVLLVDDSRAVRLICRRVMTGLGFESVEAENGREALDRVRSYSDLEAILLEWDMPIMNGLDFLKVLRAERRPLQPAVIMCTIQNKVSQIAEAMEAGASEYIMKPFNEDILRSKFQEVGVL
jgi:two-component system, chemotaxis family, chemotaxis protein CheY